MTLAAGAKSLADDGVHPYNVPMRTVTILLLLAAVVASPASAQCVTPVVLPEGGPVSVAPMGDKVAFTAFKFDPQQPPGFPPTAFVGAITPPLTAEQWPLPIPSQPNAIAVGPDGSMWITDIQFGMIHRVAPDRQLSSFSVGQDSLPYRIVVASDGTAWFTTHTGFLGRLSASGLLIKYPVWPIAFDLLIDNAGYVWVAEDRGLLRFDPTTTARQDYPVAQGTRIYRMARAEDGSIWFTDRNSARIGRFEPTAGTFKFFRLPQAIGDVIVHGIARASDGRMWFTAYAGVERPGIVGAIDSNGVVTYRTLSRGEYPGDIVSGESGILWFTYGERTIARMQLMCRRRAVRH